MLLAILLLASVSVGCVTLCSHIHREYYLIEETKTWDEAQSYCRENYADLATIGNHDDMQRLVNETAASGVTAEIWIGLKKTGVASWMWSVGETQGLAEYTNWASLPVSSHYCGGMQADGKWLSASCETTHPFVCQGEEGSSRMLFDVLAEKSWRQAQEYCRQNYIDLVSVRNQAENQALQALISGTSMTFVWIGLFRDEWKWSDQNNSSIRYWSSSQPNDDGVCTLYSPSSKDWWDRGCTTLHPFYCYNALVKKTRQIVRVEMKSNSFNFDDPDASEALLNKLQQQYEAVKLQWRVQPDGKIFHKKRRKEKKVDEPCDIQ